MPVHKRDAKERKRLARRMVELKKLHPDMHWVRIWERLGLTQSAGISIKIKYIGRGVKTFSKKIDKSI